MMMPGWLALSFIVVCLGSAAQDRWPRSIVARLAALAGGAWFAGTWLALFLLS